MDSVSAALAAICIRETASMCLKSHTPSMAEQKEIVSPMTLSNSRAKANIQLPSGVLPLKEKKCLHVKATVWQMFCALQLQALLRYMFQYPATQITEILGQEVGQRSQPPSIQFWNSIFFHIGWLLIDGINTGKLCELYKTCSICSSHY